MKIINNSIFLVLFVFYLFSNSLVLSIDLKSSINLLVSSQAKINNKISNLKFKGVEESDHFKHFDQAVENSENSNLNLNDYSEANESQSLNVKDSLEKEEKIRTLDNEVSVIEDTKESKKKLDMIEKAYVEGKSLDAHQQQNDKISISSESSEFHNKNKSGFNTDFNSILKNFVNDQNHSSSKPTSFDISDNSYDNAKTKERMSRYEISNLITRDNDFVKGEDKAKLNEEEIQDYSNLKKSDMGQGPIFASGWIKYFKFNPNIKEKNDDSNNDLMKDLPKTFNTNLEFQQERKLYPNVDLDSKSFDGKNLTQDYIKNKYLFYAVLFKDSLNIISSRKNDIKKTYETIDIKFLADVSENGRNIKSGRFEGIQEIGYFSEGYCFRINIIQPKDKSYIICCDHHKIKKELMENIKRIKILHQREIGQIVRNDFDSNSNDKNDFENQKFINISNNKDHDSLQNNQNLSSEDVDNDNIIDGKWIIIQGWSQCTLKCGGGKSFLQRLCIPPKNGGKPCQGNSILEKDCNTMPCPNVEAKNENKLNSTKINIHQKIIIKTLPLSRKPLRYRKCVIKEEEMIFSKYDNKTNGLSISDSDKNFIGDPKMNDPLPVRVVMNNMTISVFQGDEYNSHIMSFNIREAKFHKIFIDNHNCFILSETLEKMAKLCPLAYENQKGKVFDWEKDFNLFKHSCNGEEKNEVKKTDLQSKLKDAVAKLVQQNEVDKKEGIFTSFKDSLANIDKTASEAIMKEVALEELVKKQEIDNENRQEKELLDMIEAEKVKKVK